MAPFEDEDLLYHYTSAPIAVESILRTGELRLGQFAFTNDPRESRSWQMSASLPDDYDLEPEDFLKLSEEADGVLRRSVKLACFTQDDFPRDDRDGASGRGFAHSSLWSHYGGGHRGVCIGFRRDLLDRLESELSQLGDYFHGPVHYVDDASPPYEATHVDMGQVEEFGLDAVLTVRIRKNWEQLFFIKDQDWVTEREYRCVVLNPVPGPIYIDVSDHIRAVILGDSFPTNQVATVHYAVEAFKNVEVATIRYQNGRPLILPSLVPKTESTQPAHRRSGSTGERAAALVDAENDIREARGKRSHAIAGALDPLIHSLKWASQRLETADDVRVSMYERSGSALPPGEQQPAAGVPTEILQSEGALVVVEHQPQQSFTLSVAVSVQLLTNDRLRMYAVIATEVWGSNGNERRDLWRADDEVGVGDDPANVAKELAGGLERQWADAVVGFNKRRRLSE
jgi:hypothetical protein